MRRETHLPSHQNDVIEVRLKIKPVSKDIKLCIALWVICTAFLVIIPYQVQMNIEEFVSPATFPRLALFSVMGLCLILVFRDLSSNRRKKEQAISIGADPSGSRRVIVSYICLVSYFVLMAVVGYLPATFLCIGFYVRYLGGRNWKVSIPFVLLTTLLLYLFFYRFLHVPLPKGIIFS